MPQDARCYANEHACWVHDRRGPSGCPIEDACLAEQEWTADDISQLRPGDHDASA